MEEAAVACPAGVRASHLRFLGLNRIADHVSSRLTSLTPSMPNCFIIWKSLSRFRSVPSFPAFGYAIHDSRPSLAASMAGWKVARSRPESAANTRTAASLCPLEVGTPKSSPSGEFTRNSGDPMGTCSFFESSTTPRELSGSLNPVDGPNWLFEPQRSRARPKLTPFVRV